MSLLSEIRIRDPFVVAHENTYYLYGTIGEDRGERSLYTYESQDLVHWDNKCTIFTLSEDGWAKGELWAPEVHRYNGKFYLFVSILGKNGLRGTQIAVCDTPNGTFLPLVDAPATPAGQSCIDGTLYVEDGVPYMVYSHDWPDCYYPEKGVYIGDICAIQLTPDLSASVGEPFLLFSSIEVPLSAVAPVTHPFEGKMVTRYGSDGPFLQTLSDGTLYLTWSPIPGGNYVVLGAVSESGKLRGPWRHLDTPLYDQHGGHAMFFTDFSGQRKMAIHAPERYPDERACLLDVTERDGILVLQ